MVDDDHDRVENASRLAEEADGQAVAAFRAIAVDNGQMTPFRREAARERAEIDPRARRQMPAAVSGSTEPRRRRAPGGGPRDRTAIDPRAAADACCSIALDPGVDDDVRLEAARLANGDSRWATAAFRAIAADEGVDDDVREERR